MTRIIDKEEKRCDIALSAITLFCEKGIQQTSIDQIAKSAGVAKGTIYLYFKNVHHGYVPAPKTIFKNTFKLPPGHFLEIDLLKASVNIDKYWDATDFYKLPKLNLSYEDAKFQTKKLLLSACEYRMIADVPVGVFLSGGYDSTLVTSLLQTNRSEKLKTFTIGFNEGNNEVHLRKKQLNI